MSRKIENIGFMFEVTLFMVTGFYLAIGWYILALISFITSLYVANEVGKLIYLRGKNGDS